MLIAHVSHDILTMFISKTENIFERIIKYFSVIEIIHMILIEHKKWNTLLEYFCVIRRI